MAGIIGITGFRRWPRWTLTGLMWKSPKSASLAAETTVARPELRKRRSYAPPRDAFLEASSMRREMHRL